MIVTIDCNTSPREMHHLAVALQRIAADSGYKASVETQTSASQTSTIGEMSVALNVDTANATPAVEALADLIDRTGVKVEEVPPVNVSVETPAQTAAIDALLANPSSGVKVVDVDGTIEPFTIHLPGNTNLDSSGLPWDARIHAGSRERNTDGSWRVRRRPKGVEEAEWDATLARVTSELRDLMEIPVTPGAVADAAAETAESMADCFGGEPSDYSTEPLTSSEVDQFIEIMDGITDDTPAPIAPPVILPPVVLPPVTITPPAIATDTPAVTTFAQLMVWLTGHTPKDEAAKPPFVARVNEILAANQLTTLQQLGQRAELIPQVLAQFVEAFGE